MKVLLAAALAAAAVTLVVAQGNSVDSIIACSESIGKYADAVDVVCSERAGQADCQEKCLTAADEYINAAPAECQELLTQSSKLASLGLCEFAVGSGDATDSSGDATDPTSDTTADSTSGDSPNSTFDDNLQALQLAFPSAPKALVEEVARLQTAADASGECNGSDTQVQQPDDTCTTCTPSKACLEANAAYLKEIPEACRDLFNAYVKLSKYTAVSGLPDGTDPCKAAGAPTAAGGTFSSGAPRGAAAAGAAALAAAAAALLLA